MLPEFLTKILGYIFFVIIFLTGEWLLGVINFFGFFEKKFNDKPVESDETDEPINNGNSKLKGVIERLVLFTGLTLGLSQVIIAFGTLKIGTRIQPDDRKSKKIKADYFLVGNLLSLMLSIFYFFLWQKIQEAF